MKSLLAVKNERINFEKRVKALKEAEEILENSLFQKLDEAQRPEVEKCVTCGAETNIYIKIYIRIDPKEAKWPTLKN